MKKLYSFHWDCGRMGDIEGLFIAEESRVNDMIGNEIYFGEVLGKHSDIYGTLDEEDLVIKSDDQDFITKLEDVLDVDERGTISGFNPFDYYEEEE